MEFQSSLIGLALVMIAWILQLVYSKSGELKKRFVIFYGIGTAVLVIDSIVNGYIAIGIFNLIILGLACAVMIKFSRTSKNKIKARTGKKRR